MRNEIAEWMLSQVAPREQARTIVGDLLEAQPGPVAFWVAVLRATVSIGWHQPRRVFTSLFWFSWEASIYLFMGWLITKTPWEGYSHFFVLLIVANAIYLGGWLLWARKRQSSVVMMPAFFAWLQAHNGYPWAGVSLFLLTAPFSWWMRWRRQQKNASSENDRPVAG